MSLKRNLISMQQWIVGFTNFFNHNPVAEQAVLALDQAGCDLLVLAEEMYKYAGGATRDIQGGRGDWMRLKARIDALTARLKADATQVEQLNAHKLLGVISLADLVAQSSDPRRIFVGGDAPRLRVPPVDLLLGLPSAIRSYIDLVNCVAETISPEFSTRKVGPERHLVRLATYIREITDAPHYPALAYLAQAAHAGFGRDKDEDPETIRKKVDRFKARNPLTYDTDLHWIREFIHHVGLSTTGQRSPRSLEEWIGEAARNHVQMLVSGRTNSQPRSDSKLGK
jgi:hypothetical protein